jgi:hypothetical protein
MLTQEPCRALAPVRHFTNRCVIIFGFIVIFNSIADSQVRLGSTGDRLSELQFAATVSSFPSQSTSFTINGRLNLGPCFTVGAVGNFVLVTNGPVLQVLDASNIELMEIRGEFLSATLVRDCCVTDSLVVITSSDSLVILKVAADGNLLYVSGLPMPSVPMHVRITQSIAYVFNAWGLLFAVDISDISNPRIRGSIPASGLLMSAFAASGRSVYIGEAGSAAMTIVDATNLDSLTSETLPMAYPLQAAATNDTVLAILLSTPQGIDPVELYSIANPRSPREIASISVAASALCFSDSVLLLSSNDSVYSFDESIPSLPRKSSSTAVGAATYYPPSGMASSDLRAVVNYSTGALIVDVTRPDGIGPSQFFKTGGTAYSVFILDTLALVASGRAGLWIASISDPSHPRLLSNVNAGGWTCDVVAQKNLAIIVNFARYGGDTTCGLWTIDLTDPLNPQLLKRHVGIIQYSNDVAQNRLAIRGNTVFVTQSAMGGPNQVLELVDVSKPQAPQTLSTIPGRYACFDVCVNTRQAFLASPDSGLIVIDISDSLHPFETARLPITTYGVASNDSIVCSGSAYLTIVRSVPNEAPVVLSSTFLYFGVSYLSAVLSGSIFYWAQDSAGAIDMTSPLTPGPIAGFPITQGATWIYTSANKIYVAQGERGLVILSSKTTGVNLTPYEVPKEFRIFPNYPNPFNGTTSIILSNPERQRVQMDIYNVIGERVASLIDEMLGEGEFEFHFDASSIASGTYYCRARGEFEQSVIKMILLR